MYEIGSMMTRIKTLKKKHGLTNKALAEKADLPVGTLNKVLGAETKDPQLSTVLKIAQALNVSAMYLIYGEEQPSASTNSPYSDFTALLDKLTPVRMPFRFRS